MSILELVNHFLGLILISTFFIFILRTNFSLKFKAFLLSIIALIVYLFFDTLNFSNIG